MSIGEDEGKIITTLCDPNVVSLHKVDSADWSVKGMLQQVASNPEFNALIDTGALITGMSNQQVCYSLKCQLCLLLVTSSPLNRMSGC